MEIYLIRHGLAGQHGDYSDDTIRPLTSEGVKKTTKVAKQLLKQGLSFEIVLTSPLRRARQTAEILIKVGLSDRLEEFSPLAPGGEIQAWVKWYTQWYSNGSKGTIALVGHEPDLSCWAELLVWGEAKEKLSLKKAGAIGLQVPEIQQPIGESELFLLISPKWLLLADGDR
jgi:phosphohistidine phosphatase